MLRRPASTPKKTQETQEVPPRNPRSAHWKPKKYPQEGSGNPRSMPEKPENYAICYLIPVGTHSDPKTETLKFWKFEKKQIPSSFCWGLDAVRNPRNRSDVKQIGANGTQTNVRTTRNRQTMRPRKPQMKINYFEN